MIPLRDNIPSRRFPAANYLLISLNVAFFVYELSLGDNALEALIQTYGLIPARFNYIRQVDPLAFDAWLLPLFSSMFLHAGWFHLIGNMWMLYIFGDNVEDRLGHGRYLAFYLLCGLGAAFAQLTAHPFSSLPMVGASGAISGVMGGYLMLFPRARVLTLVPIFFFFTIVEIPAFVFLVLWFLIQFLSGTFALLLPGELRGGVAWWAHIGGFVTGAVLIFFLAWRRRG
ncbi:rhomboid family intramembrane serine protease [Thermosulfuriphilus sp.]